MQIRKVNINDYNEVIKLYTELYDAEKVYDDNLIDEDLLDEKFENKIKKRIKSRKEIFLVIEIDNKLVGLIDGYILENIHHKEKVVYLDHLCVDKKYRRQNIGTTLIKEFSDIAKKKGAKLIMLNAFENNTKAVNLYKKLGFREHSIYYVNEL